MERIRVWLQQNRSLINNSGALVGTALVNSGLGFAYWWLAAQYFEESVVGIASAVVSAMIFLGSVAMLGLGTLLVGELGKRKGNESSLISTGIISVSVASVLASLIFTVVITLFSQDFDVLNSSPVHLLLFVAGVSLTALTLMLDQAFIGLLQGDIQLWRNILASVLKVVFLGIIVLTIVDANGMWVFSAWVLSMAVSMFIPIRFLMRKFKLRLAFQWSLLQELGRSAMSHHWLNLALDAPIRAMPVIVTVMLSAEVNASFYIAWMIAGLLFFPVQSITLVLFAVGSQDADALATKIRSTLRLSLIIAVVGYIAVWVASEWILGIFGESYAQTASNALRIVSFAVFPLIIKDHFVAIHRIHSRARYSAIVISIGGTIEIILATLGSSIGGLDMLSAGWVLAIILEAIYMTKSVFKSGRVVSSESNLESISNVHTTQV